MLDSILSFKTLKKFSGALPRTPPRGCLWTPVLTTGRAFDRTVTLSTGRVAEDMTASSHAGHYLYKSGPIPLGTLIVSPLEALHSGPLASSLFLPTRVADGGAISL